MDLKLIELQRLNIKKDEVLVIRIPKDVPIPEVRRIMDCFKELYKGDLNKPRLVCLNDDIKLEVIHKDEIDK